MWWDIWLSLNYVFIATFGSEKKLKSVNVWQSYRQKRLIALRAMILLKD